MPNHPQSTHRLSERVHAVVRSALDRTSAQRLVVACSGGTDSTCLLHAVVTVARCSGRQVTVCHVRHGVRIDDGRDAEVVQATAKSLDIACRVVTLHGFSADRAKPPSESEMRLARYDALADVANECNADAVLTGHTLDDQVETVLLHLMRGAGLDGLGGMAEETVLSIDRGHSCLRIVRPLLSVRRDETVAYCAAHDLTVMNDPTNNDPRYTRNWLRHSVLPILRERNPDIAPVLARTASFIRDEATFLSVETARAMTRGDCRKELACIGINDATFMSEHAAIQRRMIREILQRISGAMPRATDVDGARHHAMMSQSSMIRCSGGVAYCRAFNRLVFGRDENVHGWVQYVASQRYPLSQGVHAVRGDTEIELALPNPAVTAYRFSLLTMQHCGHNDFGDAAVTVPLQLPDGDEVIIRPRQSADRFWPVGRPKPLLLRTYLSDRDVPAPVRDQLPLLVVNDTIAWVIGHDVGAEFAATEATATHYAVLSPVTHPAHERIVEKDGRGAPPGTGDGAHADDGTTQ